MPKTIYMSFAYGFKTPKPNCYHCGDCCQIIPVEITQKEVDTIAKRLKASERQLFLNSITTKHIEANVLPFQLDLPLTVGIGWLKAPCMFLGWEKRKGRQRAVCRIYKIRPRTCRNFWCGKQQPDEHLNSIKFTFKLESEEQITKAEKILSSLRQQRP